MEADTMEKTPKHSLFDEVEDAVHDVGWGDTREVLGFQNDQLVLCNGRTIERMTPRQSVDWTIRVKLAEQRGVYDSSESSYTGQVAWLTMLLATMV